MAKMKRSLRSGKDLPDRNWGNFTKDEVVAAVCKYLGRGHSVSEIVEEVRKSLGIRLKREDPYRLISYAAKHNWLQFAAPVDMRMAEDLRLRYPWLERVVVVRTSVADDLSFYAALVLKEIMLKTASRPNAPRDFHLGLGGGSALRKTCRHFAAMLHEADPKLPERIVFHAMVGGFTFHEDYMPIDANSFFIYFAGDPRLKVKTSFLGLHAPGMVRSAMIPELKSLFYIAKAYEKAKEIQVVLTSAGGHWRSKHSILYDMYSKCSPESREALSRQGTVGDMMWLPINEQGPVEAPTEMRAMTLVELTDLPRMIREGKKVLLHLGPCGNCGGDKREVLRAILGYRQPLVTHLVTDARSAQGVLEI